MRGGPQPLVERLLGPANGLLGTRRQFVGHFHCLGHEFIRRDDHADQADALGFFGIQHIAGQQIVFGLGHADQQRPDDRGVVSGSDTQPGMAVGKTRLLRGNADIGQQRDRQPGPDRHAVNRRDNGLIAVDHIMHDVPRFLHGLGDHIKIAHGFLDHIKIAPGREGPTGSRNHRHAHGGVVGDIEPDLAQLVVQTEVCRVEGLGPVNRQKCNPVVFLDDEMFVVFPVGHAASSFALCRYGLQLFKAGRICTVRPQPGRRRPNAPRPNCRPRRHQRGAAR